MSSKQVTLKVNQQRLVKNLAFAFTNRSTVLSELMQNARRAGATSVRFDCNDQDNTLVITDNGSGVQDLQNLLTIAESGWNEKIQAEEHPFGMGFMSALFAAKHVKIESRGHAIEFDTEHALNFGNIPEVPTDFIGGTRITMTGFGLPKTEVKNAMECYAKAFPIDVMMGDETLEAKHRVDDRMIDTPVGKIMLGKQTDYIAYLQGLPVTATKHQHHPSVGASVVHLDSKQFFARMPDRDVLVNVEEAEKAIDAAIRNAWRGILEAEKASKTPAEFAEEYWNLAVRFHIQDIMNDVPYLPSHALSKIDEYPRQSYWGNSYQERLQSGIAREEVEAGNARLCKNLADYLDGKAFLASVFAWKQGWLAVDAHELHDGHWAKPHVIDLAEMEPEIRLLGNVVESGYDGNYVSCDLKLCDAYEITVNGESIAIDDKSICFGEDSHDCTIVVPMESDGIEGVDQASSFNDQYDSYQEGDHEEERDELQKQVHILRGEAPEVTLEKVLDRGHIHDYQNVLGKVFLVRTRDPENRYGSDKIVCHDALVDTIRAARQALAGSESDEICQKLDAILEGIGEKD